MCSCTSVPWWQALWKFTDFVGIFGLWNGPRDKKLNNRIIRVALVMHRCVQCPPVSSRPVHSWSSADANYGCGFGLFALGPECVSASPALDLNDFKPSHQQSWGQVGTMQHHTKHRQNHSVVSFAFLWVFFSQRLTDESKLRQNKAALLTKLTPERLQNVHHDLHVTATHLHFPTRHPSTRPTRWYHVHHSLRLFDWLSCHCLPEWKEWFSDRCKPILSRTISFHRSAVTRSTYIQNAEDEFAPGSRRTLC